jgi:hypothetical protein
MATFIYRCPKTGFKVQAFVADEPTDASHFVSVIVWPATASTL